MESLTKEIVKQVTNIIISLNSNVDKSDADLYLKQIKILGDSLTLINDAYNIEKITPLRDKVFDLFIRRLEKQILACSAKNDEQSYISLANEFSNVWSLFINPEKFYAMTKEIRYNNTDDTGITLLDGEIGKIFNEALQSYGTQDNKKK